MLVDNFDNNGCKSPYPSREHLSNGERMLLLVGYTLLTPLTLVLNGFLMFGLYKTKQHYHVFSRFIFVLSLSDFCIGLFVLPVAIYLFMPSAEESCNVSWFLTLSAYILLNFSGLVIFMVAIDRFMRLRKTKRYVQSVSLKKVNVFLTGAFVFSVVTALGAYGSAVYDFFCYYNMVVITINSIAASAILFFYLLTWRNVRKQISNIRTLPCASKNSSTASLCVDAAQNECDSPSLNNLRISILKRQKPNMLAGGKKTRQNYDASMTRTVAAIFICCCTTYPPYFIVTFYRSFIFTLDGHCDRKSHHTNIYFFWTFFGMFVNSVLNAILYSCHNRRLRKLLKTLCKCACDKRNKLVKSSVMDITKASTTIFEEPISQNRPNDIRMKAI